MPNSRQLGVVVDDFSAEKFDLHQQHDKGIQSHRAYAVLTFGGEFHPLCGCGFFGASHLTSESAWAATCELQELWAVSNARQRLLIGVV